MTASRSFLAIDLGAESGRAILGTLREAHLELSEIHRFTNRPARLPDGLHWDALQLWSEIKTAIALGAHSRHDLAGIGVDTWGVDFALLDQLGSLISNPYHYRDDRTEGMLAEAFARIPRERLFRTTGNQFMPINTLYQLLAMVLNKSPQLDMAQTLLMMPDLFNYWLTRRIASEFTIATTTQCHDPQAEDWAWSLMAELGIPTRIFHQIIRPGTLLAKLAPEVAEELRIAPVAVVVPATHDTGSAVAAVPAETTDFAWISSGTWSIMGTNVQEAVLSTQALAYNFTNEGGVFDTWRLSRNLTGLWLVQECRRAWADQGEEMSYDELTHHASKADGFAAFIDPDDDSFSKPGEMPTKIGAYCSRTNQRTPDSAGAMVRCTLESLALKYRWVLERLEEINGRHLDAVHIVGGGSRNSLLNQFTANATQRPIAAGPIESTAIGNILMQAVGVGEISSFGEARSIVRKSFSPGHYEPKEKAAWDDAYGRFLQVLGNSVV
jgi:rhamnulokinase